jgi:hypothetical protein
MGDDAGARAAEDRGSEMMVGVVMREHDPFHRLVCHRLDPAEKILCLPRTRQSIDDYHARIGYDKAGIRPALGASARVADERVDAGCK